jgi:hypothetical protein
MNWPDKLEWQPDAVLHAQCILESVAGDYRIALECLPYWVEQYGASYCERLRFCLTPHGEA